MDAPVSILRAGPPPEEARVVLILVHGRGGSARDLLPLHGDLDVPGVAALAPQAPANTWYPQSFLAPLEANQPHLDRSLGILGHLVADLSARGVPGARIALLGFSQGACLALEFVARNPGHYGAVMGLTGGLLGPPGDPLDHEGDLAGTPVFLGSGDPDPHVPFARVLETEAVLARMGAQVELRRYPGRPHTIGSDEVEACRALLRRIAT